MKTNRPVLTWGKHRAVHPGFLGAKQKLTAGRASGLGAIGGASCSGPQPLPNGLASRFPIGRVVLLQFHQHSPYPTFSLINLNSSSPFPIYHHHHSMCSRKHMSAEGHLNHVTASSFLKHVTFSDSWAYLLRHASPTRIRRELSYLPIVVLLSGPALLLRCNLVSAFS